MQLDTWWQKLPKMSSLWRNWVVFPTFCDRVIEVSSLVTIKYLQFLAKTDFLMVGVDASWCLKAETDKNGFTLTILLFFLLFSVKVIKFHFGHWQKLAFFRKNWWFWEGMDATRWFKAKIWEKRVHFDDFWWFCHCFAIDSSKFVRFGLIQNFGFFGKNWLSLGKNGCN